MTLHIDPAELNSCVECGGCMSACPTFRVTGDEAFSPRGRIALMREVQNNGAPITPEVADAFSTCIQCRGCEPACSSGVPYGRLIEQTRAALAADARITPRWLRAAFAPLSRPRLLRAGSVLIGLAQRLRLFPTDRGMPRRIPLRRSPLAATGTDVLLFTGCVMDAWQRDVHEATMRVLAAAGVGVTPTLATAPCCGALHSHAGMIDRAKQMAQQVIESLPPDVPVLVNSAGCGAAMKDYGHLLGTDAARAFAARVFDVQEWLATRIDQLPSVAPLDARVAVQDPCHLRHVQKVHQATRTVLRPFVRELVELDDDGMCCGSGGSYSITNRSLSQQVRARKVQTIDAVHADIVASANPGCSLNLAAAGVPARHPMCIIDEALSTTTLR
ncbi:MAG TPA: (Fe-S)-binding protein [Ilumatobacteraceae bacterium]|nr:(Fe-S)-binding protein [Ilumatobacteraceae bacterium]